MDFIVIQTFLMTFISILLMEMGDKTQITSFTLSIKYRSQKKVSVGVSLGLFCVTLIGVVLGYIMQRTFEFEILQPVIVTLFVVAGIGIIIGAFRNENSEKQVEICPVSMDVCQKTKEERAACKDITECEIYMEEVVAKHAIIKSFLFIFLAELGDKSMLTTIALSTADNLNLIGVLLGSTLALTVVNLIGIFFGKQVMKINIKDKLELLSGFLFILVGILIEFF